MCKVRMLRALVARRLTEAADDIFGLFERTITEYEEELCRSKEENERQRQLLDTFLKSSVQVHVQDIPQPTDMKEEVTLDRHEWSASAKEQETLESRHIKVEEVWTNPEGETGNRPGDEVRSSPLQHRKSQENVEPKLRTSSLSAETAEDNREAPQPYSRFDISADHMTSDSSDETLNGNTDSQGHSKKFQCGDCGKMYTSRASLKRHMMSHTGERPHSCSGLDSCTIKYNCTNKPKVVPRQSAPTSPEWGPDYVGIGQDNHVPVPIINVTWKLRSDASVLTLRGSQLHIVDKHMNPSLCVQFIYSINQQLNPNFTKWTFSLTGVVVEAGHVYTLSAFNLPRPDFGDYTITKQVTIPGSLWDPQVTTALSVEKHQMLSIVVGFEADNYSNLYHVSIQSDGIYFSKNVSKDYRTFLNVTFALDVSQLLKCELSIMVSFALTTPPLQKKICLSKLNVCFFYLLFFFFLKIKPFFTRCINDGCRPEQMNINYCLYFPPRTAVIKGAVGLLFVGVWFASLLWCASRKDQVSVLSSATDQQLQCYQVQERKKVLILYSLDHPLYKNIVLKLCAFLTAKCGIEVILDLMDFTRLGILGRIQWLDWQRERMEGSSDKILLLCSQGVQAKWRAMCGEKPVLLREDLCSPVGDMLTPALSLIVPHLVHRASFEKYMVAYFEEICSPEDIPSPFNVTVRYKLMKQFEELFFRILDTEKHGPGRVCHIEGLAEGEYHHCPSGRALEEALEVFRAYQLKHPQWFEEELVEDLEVEERVL
ncbi:interleukin-17 receptor A isoform X2 [Phycodurus eques]|uniref:interleukin-17 receptor A isoform X2 n=1 Tax=Phycodurus eques TaxID=693459 RepID=UPI002ACEA7F1|nr:interleukin-17 receptor A isoform X2 [Phycodurus eques]